VYKLPHLEAYNAMTPAQRMQMYGTYQDPAAVATDVDDLDLGGDFDGAQGGPKTPADQIGAALKEAISGAPPHDPNSGFTKFDGQIHTGKDKGGEPTASAKFQFSSVPRDTAAEAARARMGLN
jgi:hypothetical protein